MSSTGQAKRFYFAKVMLVIFLTGFICLLAYTFWSAEIIYSGNENALYQKYYIFAIAGIVFWGAALLLRHDVQLILVLLTSSVVFALYLMEGIIFLFFPLSASQAMMAKKSGEFFDTRSKVEVIKTLQKQGVDAVTSIHPWVFINESNFPISTDMPLLPLGGISNKTVVNCNESGKYAVYQSDRFGFNNPDSVWQQQSVDWLLIGDSFAHGACVSEGADIAGQIRLKTGDNAINLGSAGNGPLTELATLTEYATTKKPRKVLWLYYEGNDLERNLKKEKGVPLLMEYLKSGFTQRLLERQSEIDTWLLNYIDQNEQSYKSAHLTRLLRLFHLRQRLGLNRLEIDVEPLFVEIMSQAKDRVRKWGGELYFVYLPEFSRYSGLVKDHDAYRKRQVVLEKVKSLGISVIDIHQNFFVREPDPMSYFPFRVPGHYTAVGYRQVANTIVRQVTLLQ